MSDLRQQVQEAIDQSVASGTETGIQVAVYRHGELVVDAVAGIAAAEPWWEPGTKMGYHALTFGYIVGELVRRATGTRISQVLREEVAAPLGVADELFFGVPASDLDRLARLEEGGEPLSAEQVTQLEETMPLLF